MDTSQIHYREPQWELPLIRRVLKELSNQDGDTQSTLEIQMGTWYHIREFERENAVKSEDGNSFISENALPLKEKVEDWRRLWNAGGSWSNSSKHKALSHHCFPRGNELGPATRWRIIPPIKTKIPRLLIDRPQPSTQADKPKTWPVKPLIPKHQLYSLLCPWHPVPNLQSKVHKVCKVSSKRVTVGTTKGKKQTSKQLTPQSLSDTTTSGTVNLIWDPSETSIMSQTWAVCPCHWSEDRPQANS